MADLATMPKYEAYKDSGVDWLGDIPSEWSLVPGLRAYSENKRNNKGLKEERVLSLSYGKIIVKPKVKLVGLVPESFETYQIVEPGDLIIRCMDLQNDKTSLRTGLAENHGIITSAYLNLKINENFDSKFLYYYLHSLDTTKIIYRFGTGLRQNLSFKDFYRLPIFDIPKSLQTAIANFLDKKTAQIDEAIAIKVQQIALLKERKKIIIQQAVTQGLNPDVPMKDSGVFWIGQIPEHWETVTKIKYISSLKGRQGWQGLKTEEYTDEGPHVLSSAHFNNYIINWNKCPRVSYTRYLMDKHIQLKIGDILLMKDGANMGKLAFIDNLPGPACLNSHLLLFRSLIKKDRDEVYFDAKYMFFHMMCSEFQDYVKINGTGATFLGISQESLGNYQISLPPIYEQQKIVENLEKETERYEKAIKQQELQIEKLKEYKTTLINSAVTGKIKVPEVI
jgi:type I restriction enzyme S subunit